MNNYLERKEVIGKAYFVIFYYEAPKFGNPLLIVTI